MWGLSALLLLAINMKNIFFFFIFLIIVQDAAAIALTPPALEFIGGNEKSFTIVNTNDFKTKFIIEPEEGFKFSQNEFALGAKEKVTINVYATNSDEREGIIQVNELVSGGKGLQLENGVGLKYHVKKETWYNKITGAALGLQKIQFNNVKWPVMILIISLIIAVIFYQNKGIRRMIRKICKIYSKLKRKFL